MRIGLISDTHIPEAGERLPPEVFDAFKGVDLVMHAGDMHVIEVLDWLEAVAPVVGARGNGDIPEGGPTKMRPGVPDDPRVQDAPVVEAGGLQIGMVHYFPVPGEVPWMTQQEFLDRHFTGPIHVVVCGHTHIAKIVENEGLLIVNPGSPTMPGGMTRVLGQVAILEVHDGVARAWIVELGGVGDP